MLANCWWKNTIPNMLTFKVEIRKNEMKVGGTFNVKIRVTYNREVKRLATHIFVRTEDLTKDFKLKNPKYIKEADRLVRHYQELCATLPLETSNFTLEPMIICYCVENQIYLSGTI